MTKKQKKELDKRDRVFCTMNTGTRYHKSKKDYDRKKDKESLRKLLTKYWRHDIIKTSKERRKKYVND